MWANSKNGFTIVELLIVVVVIAILAAITIVSYNGITARAYTSSSLSTVEEVQKKAEMWNSELGSYPNLAQLRTNSLSPPDIDTPAGGAGPITAKLSSPDRAMGATINEVRADNGRTVYYAPCGNGANITYWDYSTRAPVNVVIGSC